MRYVMAAAWRFWTRESDAAAKRRLLSLIFERVWLNEQRVVAVRPKTPFVPFFEDQAEHATAREPTENRMCKERERRDRHPDFTPGEHRGVACDAEGCASRL